MLINKCYKLPEKSAKKDFIFNMFGSMSNAAVSVVLLAIVSNISGERDAGVFSLAFSTAQLMYTIAIFEMRNIQTTDAKREFSFSDLFISRLLCILLMAVVCALFIFINGYSGIKAAAIALLTLYMAFLAFSDVFQGRLHLNGYLALAGKSLGCEVLLAAVAFSAVLAVTQNLIFAIICMIAAVAVWILLYDVPYVRGIESFSLKWSFSSQKRLFLSALPLFAATFMHQYIFNAPKYAIDTFLDETSQSAYGFLVMPAAFINLLSLFAWRPNLISLSTRWHKGEYSGFDKTVLRLYAWVAATTVAALAAGYLLGIPVLNLIYGTNLSGKRGLLLVLLLAGGFSAAVTLTLTLLTVMRKQKFALIAYSVTMLAALIFPKMLVSAWGFSGAVYSYLAEMAMLFVILISILLFNKKRWMRENVAKAD